MIDQYGFPRRSETLAATGWGGAQWRVFWSLGCLQTGAIAMTYSCPYPFPGRYFLSGRSLGMPAVTTAAITPRAMPTLRFSAATQANGSFPLNGTYNRDLTLSPINIQLGPSGAGTLSVAFGYLAVGPNANLLSWTASVSDNVPATTLSGTNALTYGGQDIWFYVAVPAAGVMTSLVLEYLDFPI